jgi:hypothetical protein
MGLFNSARTPQKAQWTANDSIAIKYDPDGNRVFKKSGSTGVANLSGIL